MSMVRVIRGGGLNEHKLWQTQTSRHKERRAQVMLSPHPLFSPSSGSNLLSLSLLLPPLFPALRLAHILDDVSTAFEVESLPSTCRLQLPTHRDAGCCCFCPPTMVQKEKTVLRGQTASHFTPLNEKLGPRCGLQLALLR